MGLSLTRILEKVRCFLPPYLDPTLKTKFSAVLVCVGTELLFTVIFVGFFFYFFIYLLVIGHWTVQKQVKSFQDNNKLCHRKATEGGKNNAKLEISEGRPNGME